MNYLNQTLQNLLKKKGCKFKNHDSKRIIESFEKMSVSDKLFKLINKDPSFRVIFNYLIKTGFLTTDKTELCGTLKFSKTPFLFEAKCKKCGNILDRPNVVDSRFKKSKQISCECGTKNSLKSKDYSPVYEVSDIDLKKILDHWVSKGVFEVAYELLCQNCDFKDYARKSTIDVGCPKCKDLLDISKKYLPTQFEEMKNLSMISCAGKPGQGYWLNWYIWKILKNNFATETGVLVIKNNDNFEADILLSFKNKLCLVDCKDSADIKGFINKCSIIKDVVDKVFFVHTCELNPGSLKAVKNILKTKLVDVTSKDVENISEIIRKKVKY